MDERPPPEPSSSFSLFYFLPSFLLAFLPSVPSLLSFFLSFEPPRTRPSTLSLMHPVSFPVTPFSVAYRHAGTRTRIHTTTARTTRSRTDCLISLPIRKTERATVKRVFCIRSQSRSLVFWLNVIAESMNSRVSLRVIKIPEALTNSELRIRFWRNLIMAHRTFRTFQHNDDLSKISRLTDSIRRVETLGPYDFTIYNGLQDSRKIFALLIFEIMQIFYILFNGFYINGFHRTLHSQVSSIIFE